MLAAGCSSTKKECTSAAQCDDMQPCTMDLCMSGSCVHIADDSKCAAGQACSSNAGCHSVAACRTAADCDDGIACTRDACDTSTGKCTHVPDTTMCGAGQLCVPGTGSTGCTSAPACAQDKDCSDGTTCTMATCDTAAGHCKYTPNDAACDDGKYCTGTKQCAPFRGCVGTPVNCDDHVACTTDACDEATKRCTHTPSDAACDNGMFCLGHSSCDAVQGCLPRTPPSCDDNNACTTDACDPGMNACTHTAIVDHSCGPCDVTCRMQTTGSTVAPFNPSGEIGVDFSSSSGGLVVRAVSQTSNDLWVPNTAQSTMSRWDAAAGVEIGRYRVGYQSGECPNLCCWSGPCNMASRVAVDSRGDAYVANRGFGMQGSVTKIASHIDRCVDRNHNGHIETSTTATPLPWGMDECVLWTAPVGVPNMLVRALTIDLGDQTHPEGYPWAGTFNDRMFFKLDPDTGAILQTVGVPVRPYGGVVTANGRLWIGTLDEGATAWIDTSTTPIAVSPRIPYPTNLRAGCINSYGITADTHGRIWFAGWNCRDALAYDPAMMQWSRIDFGGYALDAGRGITVDAQGRAWMALGGDGQSHVAYWNANQFNPGGNITSVVNVFTLPAGYTGPSGIGADVTGNIWLGHYLTSQLVKIDPATGNMTTYTGPDQIYTYSDFTGAVRRALIRRGVYREDVSAHCARPSWDRLDWNVTVPQGASVSFAVRTASTATTSMALDAVPSLQVAQVPTATTANLTRELAAAHVSEGPLMRVIITLETSDQGVSPVVRTYTLHWHCN